MPPSHVSKQQNVITEPLRITPRFVVLRLSKDKGSMKSSKGEALQGETIAKHQVSKGGVWLPEGGGVIDASWPWRQIVFLCHMYSSPQTHGTLSKALLDTLLPCPCACPVGAGGSNNLSAPGKSQQQPSRQQKTASPSGERSASQKPLPDSAPLGSSASSGSNTAVNPLWFPPQYVPAGGEIQPDLSLYTREVVWVFDAGLTAH